MHLAGSGDPEPDFAWRPHLAGAVRARGLPRRVAWPLRLQGEPAGDALARSKLLERSPDLQVLAEILKNIYKEADLLAAQRHFCMTLCRVCLQAASAMCSAGCAGNGQSYCMPSTLSLLHKFGSGCASQRYLGDVPQGMAVVPLQLSRPAPALAGAQEERAEQAGPASSMDPSPDLHPSPADAVLLRLGATGDLYVNNCRLPPGLVRPEPQVRAGAAQPELIGAGTLGTPGEAAEARAVGAAAVDAGGGDARGHAAGGARAAAEPLGYLGAMLGGGLKGPGPTYDIRAPTGGPADAGAAPGGPASADMPAAAAGDSAAAAAGDPAAAAAAATPLAAAAGVAVAPAHATPPFAAPATGSAARGRGLVRNGIRYLCRALFS